jgi:hypothetical protein
VERMKDNSCGQEYTPMESQETESYKKFIKYHLRNNIIEILFKKSNCMVDESQERYQYLKKH